MGPDASDNPPERIAASTGAETPCRHCLKQVPRGAPSLLLAHRPFSRTHPYAETGPTFLCAEDCAPADGRWPQEILTAPAWLIRAYDAGERLLARGDVDFVDIRSASNNCFLRRVTKG